MVCGLSAGRSVHKAVILFISFDCADFGRGDSVRGFANQRNHHQTVGPLIIFHFNAPMRLEGDADLEKASPAFPEVVVENFVDVALP